MTMAHANGVKSFWMKLKPSDLPTTLTDEIFAIL
jgi:hypothetical protein